MKTSGRATRRSLGGWAPALAILPLCSACSPGEGTPGGTPGSSPSGASTPTGPTEPAGPTATPVPLTSSCPDLRLALVHAWEGDAIVDPTQPTPQAYTISGPGVGIGDLDGDGWLDVFMAVPLQASRVFRNDGAGNLELDAGFTADGGPLPYAAGVALADVDGDGDLDALLTRGSGATDLLLVNDGGGAFTTRTLSPNTGNSRTPTFVDVDADGDLDLFITQGEAYLNTDAIQAGEMGGTGNLLYRNDGGVFVDATDQLPAEIVDAISYEGVFVDADLDGDLDLYLVNDFGMWADPNSLSLNDGRGRFTLAEGCDCEQQIFGMGGAMGDVNGDGIADLYMTNIGGPQLLVGIGQGRYYDGTFALGASIPAADDRLASWGVTFADLNQDGHLDALLAFGQLLLDQLPSDVETLEEYAGSQGEAWVDSPTQRDAVLRNEGGRGFTDVSVEAGFQDDAITRSVAVGDLDKDGLPDVVTAGIPFLKQWRNVSACAPGVTLALDDGALNRAGIGAKVVVAAGERVRTEWMLRASSFSTSAPELYLGLGRAQALDVQVTWPDGRKSAATGLTSGDRVTLSPGGAEGPSN